MVDIIKSRIKNLTKRLKSIKARDIMTRDVITTTADTPLSDIAELMIKTRISGLPVMGKKGKMIGIITANDLLIVMDMIKSGDVVENGVLVDSNPVVKFAMSTDVIKIKGNTTLDEIIGIVKYRNAHTLPVFEGGKMVGVVGRRDVFKTFYAVLKGLYL